MVKLDKKLKAMSNTPIVRSPYMHSVWMETYKDIGSEAVLNGFAGAWERVISKRLMKDYLNDHSECCEIVDSVGKEFPLETACQMAAYLIRASKIPSEDKADIVVE